MLTTPKPDIAEPLRFPPRMKRATEAMIQQLAADLHECVDATSTVVRIVRDGRLRPVCSLGAVARESLVFAIHLRGQCAGELAIGPKLVDDYTYDEQNSCGNSRTISPLCWPAIR
jgi:hypothetical protein